MNLETVTTAYLTAIDFADCGEDDQPSHDLDFHPKLKEMAKTDCQKFLELAGPILEQTDYTDEQTGHDLYLTRQGHGCGFWEGDHCTKDQGNALTEIVKKNFKSLNIFEYEGMIYAE